MKKKLVFPAPAGVILGRNGSFRITAGFPRTCGGDPVCRTAVDFDGGFSPHLRG